MKCKLVVLLNCLLLCGCGSIGFQDLGVTESEIAAKEETVFEGYTDVESSVVSSYDIGSNETVTLDYTQYTNDILGTDVPYFTEHDVSNDVVYQNAYSEVLFNSDSIETTSVSAVIEGRNITITEQGSYYVTGELVDGSIIIEMTNDEDAVQLIFDGVTINNSLGSCIHILDADKVYITSDKDSVNSLSSIIDLESSVDGTVFSRANLTFNGTGILNIDSNLHGICATDFLVFGDGTYNITAGKTGVDVNDGVAIYTANMNITAGKDGIHSSWPDDEVRGYIFIVDGTFNIVAEGDGLDSSSVITIENGYFDILAGGGYTFGVVKDTESVSENVKSTKGIKADENIIIRGGEFVLDTADDSIHSNINLEIDNGTFYLYSGDDAIHAENNVRISGGVIRVMESYEGIEGSVIEIFGGEISIVSLDDGLNAVISDNGVELSDLEVVSYESRGVTFTESTEINIYNGSITIQSGGNGLDSNGSILMSDGELYISTEPDLEDTVINYVSSCILDGVLIVTGNTLQEIEKLEYNTVNDIVYMDLESVCAGSITLEDSNGDIIVTHEPTNEYQTILISSDKIQTGKEYTLICEQERYSIVSVGV